MSKFYSGMFFGVGLFCIIGSISNPEVSSGSNGMLIQSMVADFMGYIIGLLSFGAWAYLWNEEGEREAQKR